MTGPAHAPTVSPVGGNGPQAGLSGYRASCGCGWSSHTVHGTKDAAAVEGIRHVTGKDVKQVDRRRR